VKAMSRSGSASTSTNLTRGGDRVITGTSILRRGLPESSSKQDARLYTAQGT
jgi:hypothetical protein